LWQVGLNVGILAENPYILNSSHLTRQTNTEEATLHQEEYAEVEEGSEEWKASLETPIPPLAAYGLSLVPY